MGVGEEGGMEMQKRGKLRAFCFHWRADWANLRPVTWKVLPSK